MRSLKYTGPTQIREIKTKTMKNTLKAIQDKYNGVAYVVLRNIFLCSAIPVEKVAWRNFLKFLATRACDASNRGIFFRHPRSLAYLIRIDFKHYEISKTVFMHLFRQSNNGGVPNDSIGDFFVW